MILTEAVEAMRSRCKHECEAWQIREDGRSGGYCAACGCETSRNAPRTPTPNNPSNDD